MLQLDRIVTPRGIIETHYDGRVISDSARMDNRRTFAMVWDNGGTISLFLNLQAAKDAVAKRGTKEHPQLCMVSPSLHEEIIREKVVVVTF